MITPTTPITTTLRAPARTTPPQTPTAEPSGRQDPAATRSPPPRRAPMLDVMRGEWIKLR